MKHRFDDNGNEFYLDDADDYHRDDGPAIIYFTGEREWYQHGNLDREDGPAREHADGSEEWYREGVLHCVSGPAIRRSDGSEEWWCCGHRVDRNIEHHFAICQRVEYKVLKQLCEKLVTTVFQNTPPIDDLIRGQLERDFGSYPSHWKVPSRNLKTDK